MLHRLSVDESCKDGDTCPSVWVDDDDLTELVIVGLPVPSDVVPMSTTERAIRVRRQIVLDAKLGS